MASTEKSIHKYAVIKTDLTLKILNGELRVNDRIPTLDEICEHYGVSKITARRALRDLVGEGLVEAIPGKGSFVVDNGVPRQAAPEATNQNVGVVFWHAVQNFMTDMILGIDEELYRHAIRVSLNISHDSFEREAEILDRLVQQGVRRIILAMVNHYDCFRFNENLSLYLDLHKANVNLILVDNHLPNVPIPAVVWDDRGGMKELVAEMASRGRRTLTYFSRTCSASSVSGRLEGFKEGLLECDLPYDPDRVIWVKRENHSSFAIDSHMAAAEMLSGGHRPDAILCSDEEVAFGVFQAIDACPDLDRDDLLVGGFGYKNSPQLASGFPYVMVEQDTIELGRAAAKAVLEDKDNGTAWQEKEPSSLIKVLTPSLHSLPEAATTHSE